MDSPNKNESEVDPNKRSRRRINGFEEWGGYMASKKSKLNNQFEKQKPHERTTEEKRTKIFEGVSIYVNGYTKPSAIELKRLMMLHGGIYHYYNTPSTSHTVASNLPLSKIKNLKNEKVVTPDWITDSIEAGKLLPYTSYLLYKPETFNQNQLQFQPRVFPNPPDIVASRSDAFQPNKTSISTDCDASANSSSVAQLCDNVAASTAGNNDSEGQSSRIGIDTAGISNSRVPLKAGDPGFISEFYSHSRLHHISTACQDLKLYVQELASNHQGKSFPAREELFALSNPYDMQEQERVIMHLDLDCFFVSVGLRKHPELRGHPVAVAHSRGRRPNQESSTIDGSSRSKSSKLGHIEVCDISSDEEEKPAKIPYSSPEFGSMSEIASCNYQARQAGLRNGMLLGEAMRRCPSLKIIPYDFEAYTEVSKQLYDIVASFTLDIEAVSCDELYIDCTDLLRQTKVSPVDFATFLRNRIYDNTGCTASAGIGENMLLARLATRMGKPNGQYMVHSADVSHFIASQEVENIPGVGYASCRRLEKQGVHTCGDLQKWTLGQLQQEFGPKKGQTLFEHCRGKDNRLVSFDKDRKSVSSDINYGVRLKTEGDLQTFIQQVASEIESKLKKIKKKGRSVTLRLMVRKPDAPIETEKFLGHGSCDNISKSVNLLSATDDSSIIASECLVLIRSLKIPPHELRGLGIQISKLESSTGGDKAIQRIDSYISKIDPSSIARKNSLQGDVSSISRSIVNERLEAEFPNTTAVPSMSDTPVSNSVPWTELDQSVLNALPEDIRNEVLASYSSRGGIPGDSPFLPSSPPQANGRSSNSTAGSPSQPNVRSSNFATTSPSRATHQKATKTKTKKKANLVSSNQPAISTFCEKAQVSPDASLSQSLSYLSQNSSVYATLIGTSDIDEVRSLVKEWIASSLGPTEEDIDEFRNYLLSLVDENLEKTDLVLKYFFRIAGSAGELWRECYLTILSYVQQKMLEKHGYMLKAKNDFSTT